MTTTDDKQFLEVTIKMRLGTPEDFKKEAHFIDANGRGRFRPVPKLGQPYWVKSGHTGKFENRQYQISEDTDWEEFRAWMRNKMVYVPAGYFELRDAGEI